MTILVMTDVKNCNRCKTFREDDGRKSFFLMDYSFPLGNKGNPLWKLFQEADVN